MLYCISDAKSPLEYISSGNLVNENGFIHPSRNLDSFVFILVIEGTLHITQGMTDFNVEQNQFIILFPGISHYGTRPSSGRLSYYWTHFHIKDPNYTIYSRSSLLRHHESLTSNLFTPTVSPVPNVFFLPEYGTLSIARRSSLLFVQLLDIAKNANYQPTWSCHYALSCLLMELTAESLSSNHLKNDIPNKVADIIEWIRIHFNEPICISDIADYFGYNPTYMTSLFKKYTGYPLISYINHTRITAAKNLLVVRDAPVSTIASLCGFSDEKHFMRLFKKYEGITPTQYRKTFHQKKLNIN